MSIAENLNAVRQQITHYCKNYQRDSQDVRLLAVSKTKPLEAVLQAVEHGQTAFGENYVQEGVDKIRACCERQIALEWHFIGALQSNKTRLVAEYFDWMQTLARAKIAERLNAQRPVHMAPLNVLIQVNISQEASKSGIQPEELMALANAIVALPRLRLRGLMAIPESVDSEAAQSLAFEKMSALFVSLQQAFPAQPIDTLSMGMSNDMASAIKFGSTMVRIGTAIFGQR